MTIARRDIVLWAPRIIGLGLALSLSLFALDAFNDPRGVIATIIAVLMGMVPAFITLVAVIIGWKHEGIAAAIFLAGAIFYAVSSLDHPNWIFVIASPLVLEAVLFYLSWRQSKQRDATPETA